MADATDAPEDDKDEASAKEGETEGAEAPPAASGKRKMLLIISAAVAVIGIAVAVGVVFFMGGDTPKDAHEAEQALPTVVIYDVPEFNLSLLADDPAARHFIKIKISLQLAKPGDSAAAAVLLPRLQDDWGGLLRQMRVGDVQGSANLHRLKENLLRRARQSLEPVEVQAVYIRELLVQ